MLIKFEANDDLADALKAHYCQRVASKAFSMAAADALGLAQSNQELHDVIYSQRIEIRRLQGIIEQARGAAAQLLEKTGQGDLLNDSVPNSRPGSAGPAPIGSDGGTISPMPGESMIAFVDRLSRRKANG